MLCKGHRQSHGAAGSHLSAVQHQAQVHWVTLALQGSPPAWSLVWGAVGYLRVTGCYPVWVTNWALVQSHVLQFFLLYNSCECQPGPLGQRFPAGPAWGQLNTGVSWPETRATGCGPPSSPARAFGRDFKGTDFPSTLVFPYSHQSLKKCTRLVWRLSQSWHLYSRWQNAGPCRALEEHCSDSPWRSVFPNAPG